MIEGRLIICLANSWDYDPTSKHQIMRILARHNDIIWVNYHGTRRPQTNASDLRAGFATLRRVAGGLKHISPSMVQITPLVIPGARKSIARRLHRWMLIKQIRRAVKAVPGACGKPLQVWSFAPDVPYLVGAFGEECFVYYCVDEYTQFKGFNQKAIIQSETELLDRADVAIVTSQALLESKCRIRPDAALVRHGVDYEHFAAAWQKELESPQDVAATQGPIFGFFGLIHHWIDRRLIAEVAERLPEYAFVLIGDCRADVSRLEALPNVHLLGRRPYESLPAYCRAFTAGLLPFVEDRMTRCVNPIKMCEYLAAGLPVVSTPLPEAGLFEGPIRIAASPDAFVEACRAIVAETNAAKASERRQQARMISDTVKMRSWHATVERVSDLVMSCVHGSGRILKSSSAAIRENRPIETGSLAQTAP
ncbi:MAG: glycosyltransferase [Phycisphaerales bacterium]|nr:MAG: glycosyltransferase [Phycisphaerales bacterium]